MIYIFRSMHGDPTETPELKRHFFRLNRVGGVMALELESSKQTIGTLRRLGELTDKEIYKVVKEHYGWTTAPMIFLKLLSEDYSGIKEIITIEPKVTSKSKRLDKILSDNYSKVHRYRKLLTSKKSKPDLPSIMLEEWFNFYKNLQIQCYYREKAMVKKIEKLMQRHPNSEVFVYCGAGHDPFIRDYFTKKGVEVVMRKSIYAKKLSDKTANFMKLGSQKSFNRLSENELLAFAVDLLGTLVSYNHRALSCKQDIHIDNLIRKQLKSIEDYDRLLRKIDSLSELVWNQVKT